MFHFSNSNQLFVFWDVEALPLGCRSGRSAWRCCSQCKSTKKKHTHSHIRSRSGSFTISLKQLDWYQLSETTQMCLSKNRDENRTNEAWQHLYCPMTDPCSGTSLSLSDETQTHCRLSCICFHTNLLILLFALGLQNHWPGGVNGNEKN